METTIIRNLIKLWGVREYWLKKENLDAEEIRTVQITLKAVLYGLTVEEKTVRSNEGFNKTLVEGLEREQTETWKLLSLWKELYPLKETVEIDTDKIVLTQQ